MINIARKFLNAGVSEKKEILDYYNRNCYPLVPKNRKYKIKFHDEWCAAFTSVIAHKAGIRAEFPFEVSTYYQLKWAQENGKDFYNVNDCMENDLVLFDWNGNGVPNHVGIVVSNYKGRFETIEGNKNDTVGFRVIDNNSSAIIAFIRTPIGNDDEDDKAIDYMARAVIRGQYGDGEARKVILGDDYAIVQRRVNEILNR